MDAVQAANQNGVGHPNEDHPEDPFVLVAPATPLNRNVGNRKRLSCESADALNSGINNSLIISPDTKCAVCGDKASGYNFGAITCESCKDFFRRNAFIEKELRCPSHGKCVANAPPKGYCQKCKVRKCFVAGMMAKGELTNPQAIAKRRRVQTSQDGKVASSNLMGGNVPHTAPMQANNAKAPVQVSVKLQCRRESSESTASSFYGSAASSPFVPVNGKICSQAASLTLASPNCPTGRNFVPAAISQADDMVTIRFTKAALMEFLIRNAIKLDGNAQTASPVIPPQCSQQASPFNFAPNYFHHNPCQFRASTETEKPWAKMPVITPPTNSNKVE